MVLLDRHGRWLGVNEAFCRITGRSRAEVKATTLRAMTHPDDADLDAESLRRLQAGAISSFEVEKRLRHANGHDVWVLLSSSMAFDDHRRPRHLLTQVQDISERKEMALRLEYVVDHDFLTGLMNRRRFEQELTREAVRATRYGNPGAVLLLDVDHFKGINDTFGHRAGDDVLKWVAGLLRERLRDTDLLARVGGDEFAVLLTQTPANQVQIVADDLVRAIGRRHVLLADQSIRVTASVGVAMLDGLTDVEVLANADRAMYDAKEAGRDRFEVCGPPGGGPEWGSEWPAETERIRRMLEEQRLVLFGQPTVDLGTNEICQVELLLRLPDAREGELLPPSAFLYRAERSGLIQAIDAWVSRQGIGLIAAHARAGRRIVLSVNLSGKSIGDRRLLALIEKALDETGIDPACLIFELTETAAMSNFEEARAFATRLHARGCRFALDDFGAGFGSFYYLKNFPFDYLKIDGDFVRDIVTSPTNQLLVKAIVGIARGMEKRTIAEFVGDAESAWLLGRLGVDFAQGFHIGEPAPVAQVLARETTLPDPAPEIPSRAFRAVQPASREHTRTARRYF
jgi:diguanylate cyclase (GGDEF)-like protein/PAS domain S-box-containing protein